MDPITAIFNFLSTPAGQLVVTEGIKLGDTFAQMLIDLVAVVHGKNPVPAPVASLKP